MPVKPLFENIQQFWINESCSYPIQEYNGPIKYPTNEYAMPEGCTEQYEDEIEFNSDSTQFGIHNMCLNKVNIKAGFIPDKTPIMETDENNLNWLIKEEFVSEITLSGLEEVEHDIEFFPIQTSNRRLELTYEGANVREDFHENISNNRGPVLDTVDGIGLPYSTESCYFKLSAGEKPPLEKILTLSDCPHSKIPLETKWGRLQNVERYQEFYVHLVRRDCYNGEWRYLVLHTFIWYIYWDVRNNIYRHGIKTSDAVLDLSKININRTCNKDQFMHYIDLETNQFHIYNYPNYDCEKQFFDEIFTKFHSSDSCYELPTNAIKLESFHWSNKSILEKLNFICKLSLLTDLLFFSGFVNILLRCWDNRDWKNAGLYTSDKHIYLNFFRPFLGYSGGTLQDSLKINILQTSNINQFNIWNEFGNNQFTISNYPDFHMKTETFDDVFTKLHSNEGCNKSPENEIPHVEIKLQCFDWPKFEMDFKKSIFIIKLSIQSNLLFLQNLERNQQFCSFILLGYWNNLNWKYFVLQTYNYSIYLDWINHFSIGYKSGNNRYKTVHDLLELQFFRTCNNYQFFRWVHFANRFNIFDYPNFRFNDDIFEHKIKSAVIPFN